LQKSLEEVHRSYSAISQALITASLLALAAALSISLFLVRTVTRLVERLARAVQPIGQGDYGHQGEVTRQDELGALAAAFNKMESAVAEHESRIAHQALRDTRTGLPNRALARDGLQSAILRAARRACLGGDEFLMLVEYVNLAAVMAIGGKPSKTLCEPMKLEKAEVHTDVSIGISLYPDHGSGGDSDAARRHCHV